jgi:Spy/CpxP family protein refolding chaperone
MHKRKKLILSASALGVLAASAIAWGVNDGPSAGLDAPGDGDKSQHWGRRHGGGPLARLSRHLDLSETQTLAITAILNNSRAEADVLRLQLEELRGQVGGMIRTDGYDEDEVRILVENQAPTFVEMTLLGIRTMSQVYAELTPEQRAEADALMEKRRGRRFGGGGFGMQGW